MFISFLLAALSMACSSESEKLPVRPFEHVYDITADTIILKGITAIKVITGKEQVESKEINNPNWSKELAPFLAVQFNRPGAQDKYTEKHIETRIGGVEFYRYEAKDESERVQLAEYRYEGEKCTRVRIRVKQENKLFNFRREMVYYPGKGYRIVSDQKVEFVFDEHIEIDVRFKHNPRLWEGKLLLGEADLPFYFGWNEVKEIMTIHNAGERIQVREVSKKGDSLILKLPVFNSEFRVLYDGKSMEGVWRNYDKGNDYEIDFVASPSHERFYDQEEVAKLNGQYEVSFEDDYKAIGIFEQNGSELFGSFATETGDYRYLQGSIIQDSFYLSTFDGSHAFLFTGTIEEDVVKIGNFYSGNHYLDNWSGQRNPTFNLRPADSLTYLKEGYDKFAFSFPDLKNNMVSLTDNQFKDKVVLVTIMGSWCPNCMDETRYLSTIYPTYHPKGLEVVALAYERTGVFEKDRPTLERAIRDLGAPYQFLMAGKADKIEAAKTLPMLNHVMSFPTTIFIDKNGKVRKIHTGFYGPGTGKLFDDFRRNTEQFLEELLAE